MLTLVRPEPQTDSDADHSNPAERRRGLRIAQNRPVKVFEPSSSRYFPGQTEDVSATGLRIELPVGTPVVAGRVINIHVGVTSSGEGLANRRQMIPARIVWLSRDALTLKRGTMTAGIEFIPSIAAHRDAA